MERIFQLEDEIKRLHRELAETKSFRNLAISQRDEERRRREVERHEADLRQIQLMAEITRLKRMAASLVAVS